MNAAVANVVGLDLAKNVFQAYWVEVESGEIKNVQIKRAKLLEHFANREKCVVGMEVCGGAQYWARELSQLGHEIVMMPAKAVKAFVTGNKSDAIDAHAIWMAVRQGGIKCVAVKTEAQQAVLALHRMRQQLVKVRTMQINELRGLLGEYGEVFGKQRAPLVGGIASALDRLAERLPRVVIDSLRDHWLHVGELDSRIKQIEMRLTILLKSDRNAMRISQIPGVGLLTATAASAAIGQSAEAFKSGREFAAWVGLVPAHTGTGGKTRMLGISKRGDSYLRTLLIHGARGALLRGRQSSAWFEQLLLRRPKNVAVVALANKMARTIWALLRYDRDYKPGWATATQN